MGLEGLSRCDTAIFTPILAFPRRGGRDFGLPFPSWGKGVLVGVSCPRVWDRVSCLLDTHK